MSYLIDSDVLIDYLEESVAAVRLVDDLRPDGIAMGVVTYMEVFQGTISGPVSRILSDRFDALIATITIHSFIPQIARRCAHLRDELRRRGRPVRPRHLDLINAATAIEFDLTLVTRNTVDYEDIPGLRIR